MFKNKIEQVFFRNWIIWHRTTTKTNVLVFFSLFSFFNFQPDYDEENGNKIKSFFRSKSKDSDRKKHGKLCPSNSVVFLDYFYQMFVQWKIITFIFLLHQTVTEDPYYCGLSARVPKFDRAVVPVKKSNKCNQNVMAVPKRMSVAYLHHPLVYPPAPGSGYQYPLKQQQFNQKHKNLMVPRQNFMMWHARSMESGLGECLHFLIF